MLQVQMLEATYFASVGAVLSMVSNIPQVYKIRTFDTTKNLHAYSFFLHFVAALSWSTYGFMLRLYILGLESAFVAFLNLLILLAIWRDREIVPNNNLKV